jgi:hypothetical protein
MGFHKRSVEDFVGRAQSWLQTNGVPQTEEIAKENFDWGKLVSGETYLKQTPSLQFM